MGLDILPFLLGVWQFDRTLRVRTLPATVQCLFHHQQQLHQTTPLTEQPQLLAPPRRILGSDAWVGLPERPARNACAQHRESGVGLPVSPPSRHRQAPRALLSCLCTGPLGVCTESQIDMSATPPGWHQRLSRQRALPVPSPVWCRVHQRVDAVEVVGVLPARHPDAHRRGLVVLGTQPPRPTQAGRRRQLGRHQGLAWHLQGAGRQDSRGQRGAAPGNCVSDRLRLPGMCGSLPPTWQLLVDGAGFGRLRGFLQLGASTSQALAEPLSLRCYRPA